ncbi:MAG: transcriptional regulator [Arachnia sp.]
MKAEFNELIHAPHRLRICAMLWAADAVEFATLREHLGVADSVLSKNLKALVDAGYVALDKQTSRGRSRTWARLLVPGRTAWQGHLAALQEMVAVAQDTEPG